MISERNAAHAEIVASLLEANANPTLVGEYGTPLEEAVGNEMHDVVAVIQPLLVVGNVGAKAFAPATGQDLSSADAAAYFE